MSPSGIHMNGFHHAFHSSNQLLHPQPRLSRSSSFGHSIEDHNASLYIAKEQAHQSDVDSDTHRKEALLNLKRDFESYQANKPSPPHSSEFTSNGNIEFETISNGSN